MDHDRLLAYPACAHVHCGSDLDPKCNPDISPHVARQITFVSDLGTEEAGIDGGGVFKEFLDALSKRAFDPVYALFRVGTPHVALVLFPRGVGAKVRESDSLRSSVLHRGSARL